MNILKSWPGDISASDVLHSLPNAVFFTDPQMRIIYFNLAAERITGFKAHEACGMYCKDVLKTGICETECVVKRALDADENIFNIETTIKTAAGKAIPALVSASLIKDTVGKIVGYLYSFRDISLLKKVMEELEASHVSLEQKNLELRHALEELKKTEESLRKSEEEKTIILDTMSEKLSYRDKDMKILWVNRAFVESSGFTLEETKGRYCYEILNKRSDPCPECPMHVKIFQTGQSQEAHITMSNGKSWFVRGNPVRDSQGDLTGIVALALDITKQKQTEEALKESEGKLNAMLQAIGDHMSMMDKDLNIIWANDIAKKVFGDDVVGKKCYEAYHKRHKPCEPHPCLTLKAFQDEKVHEHETQVIDKDGNIIYFHCTANVALRDKDGKPTTVIEVSRNITESKKIEQQLLHAQKMEAVGQLAGGIAHDFNNILTVILGFANILQMDMSKDDPLQINIVPIVKAAKKASDLTRALLAFSRKQIINPKPVNINQIITGVEELLSRIIGEDIKLSVILADKDLIIMADANQIEQVLMNLFANARDAMPEGGKLTISTGFMKIDDKFMAAHAYGSDGLYALISVEDTGHGIDRGTKERIFEPFFTTKEVGKGTGLGLAMVYGIIEQHEGYVNVYSEPGKGTAFKIYLPLIKSTVEDTKPADSFVIKEGSETILVAEDDMQVRNFIKKLLEKYGYKVIVSVDGEDAISVFNENKDKIQLIILDTIMPKKSGKEVYDEIKKVRPDIKAIFTSGYISDIIQKKGILDKGMNFIPKPISPHEFLTKIYEVLHNN